MITAVVIRLKHNNCNCTAKWVKLGANNGSKTLIMNKTSRGTSIEIEEVASKVPVLLLSLRKVGYIQYIADKRV